MEFLRKEDELLIQNRIEGHLTAEEIEKFEKLISSSPLARKFYNDLLIVDNLCIADAKTIKEVNFSRKIMQRVKSINFNASKTKKDKRSPFLFFRSNSLAVAAVLIIGLITGGIATFILNQQEPLTGSDKIAGTIAANQADESYYNKYNTEIKTQDFEAEQLKFTIISVDTKENIQCIIPEDSGLSDKNIILLQSNGKFTTLESNTNIKYEFAGKVTFQIYRASHGEISEPVNIDFIKNGKRIKTVILN